MVKTAKNLKGTSIAATDGDIGSVQDLYFDDRSWTIRYLVVDTAAWLPGRKVLLSPIALRSSAGSDSVSVALTKSQVEESPTIDADKPVNRQYEEEYSRYLCAKSRLGRFTEDTQDVQPGGIVRAEPTAGAGRFARLVGPPSCRRRARAPGVICE